MDKELMKSQDEALAEMKLSVWYSAYDLNADFETLTSLCDIGLLYRHVIKDGPIAFVMFRKVFCKNEERI